MKNGSIRTKLSKPAQILASLPSHCLILQTHIFLNILELGRSRADYLGKQELSLIAQARRGLKWPSATSLLIILTIVQPLMPERGTLHSPLRRDLSTVYALNMPHELSSWGDRPGTGGTPGLVYAWNRCWASQSCQEYISSENFQVQNCSEQVNLVSETSCTVSVSPDWTDTKWWSCWATLSINTPKLAVGTHLQWDSGA